VSSPLPPFVFRALPSPPAGFGLFDAINHVFDIPNPSPDDQRVYGGVIVLPVNCSESFGTWPSDPCAAPPDGEKKAGDRPVSDLVFEPLLPWAYDECDPQEPVSESQALAQQTLTLKQRLLAESDFAALLLDQAGTPQTAPTLVDGIGLLEESLGETGSLGVIHASRRFAAEASTLRWTNQTGPVLKSPLGHNYAFGGGYGAVLGNTLVATGQLYMWRYPPTVITTLDPATNRLATIAEQVVVVGYECFVAAVTIG
jgi:hypothetical protein